MDGLIIVNKQADFTSHDIVAIIRGISGQKKVGHSGTLDPMATGVLVTCLGRATRAVSFLSDDDKCYIASLKLGITTDTQDITGKILKRSDLVPSKDEVEKALKHFTGEIIQMPPMFSAIKIKGQTLYKLARQGIEVERESRKILIRSIDILSFEVLKGEYDLRVECSKGTYIRTLCSDIGEYLGCGGTMASLKRIRCGRFTIDEAYTLDELKMLKSRGEFGKALIKTEDAFSFLPCVYVDDKNTQKIKNGVTIDFPERGHIADYGQKIRVFGPGNEFLMLASRIYDEEKKTDLLKCEKSFYGVF